MADNTKAGPCIKWVGGKTQIINTIMNNFPKVIRNYHEPFIGGGSVLIELLEGIDNTSIVLNGDIFISDINAKLINVYNTIKTECDKLMEELNILIEQFQQAKEVKYAARYKFSSANKTIQEIIVEGRKPLYYYFRELFNSANTTGVKQAALFIFLNKTCFRGLYREGKNGFNTPYGNYKNPTIYSTENLRRLSYLFNKYKVTFTVSSFADLSIIPATKSNNDGNVDFVYLDPPYYPISDASFVSYSESGFGQEEHNKLLEFCNNLHKNKIKFLHSNSDCKFNNDNYKQFNIQKIKCKRSINSKNPGSTINEVLIANYELQNMIN